MIYDPGLHEYSENGKKILSVTQVLQRAGIINSRFFTQESRDRGSAAHKLCERYANGIRIDEIGRTIETLEYCNAFSSWMRNTRAYAITTECRIDKTIDGMRYAGTYDLLAEVGGKRVLIDIKTGVKAASHKIQLAAYALAVDPDKIGALYIKASGKYQLEYMTGYELTEAIRQWKWALKKAHEEIAV
jgi:CRISPR/Cas system-associated exonuclease Cas4 (RecB family)